MDVLLNGQLYHCYSGLPPVQNAITKVFYTNSSIIRFGTNTHSYGIPDPPYPILSIPELQALDMTPPTASPSLPYSPSS